MSASGNAQAIFDSIAERNEEIVIEDFMTRLHDFGHSDADILQLFDYLDTDNSSTIDRDEFIKGYKQYVRSTGTNLGQEWRLWNQLDQRDEEDRLKMAKLFMVLDDKMGEVPGCAPEAVRAARRTYNAHLYTAHLFVSPVTALILFTNTPYLTVVLFALTLTHSQIDQGHVENWFATWLIVLL